MVSESARMNSSAEARFRLNAPNSRPRAVTIVALDAAGRHAAAQLAPAHPHAQFLTAVANGRSLADLEGRPQDLGETVRRTDLIVFIAGPGGDAHAAPVIGAACSDRRVMTTALIVGSRHATDADIARTLALVRPWSLMVVIADSVDYIDDMLSALRA